MPFRLLSIDCIMSAMYSSQNRYNKRILIVDPIHEDAISLLTEMGHDVKVELFPDKDRFADIVKTHDVLVCRTHTKLNQQFFAENRHLVCVALASTGFDQIDVISAAEFGVPIIGLPADNKSIDPRKHGNFISTAEHTIMLMLMALNDSYNAAVSMKGERWEKNRYVGREAYHKTLGIVGFGRIGKLVAARAQAFGMQTIAYDPFVSLEEMAEHNTDKIDFLALCKEADVITIHAPKTSETEGMFTKDAFTLMKQGSIIVNTARSDIINTTALMQALNNGKLHRYATDVHRNEPVDIEWQIVQHDKVIATPHVAGSTSEALKRISESTVRSLLRFLESGEMINVINKELFH